MARILGLDLGTNSIGWAVIDDTAKEIIKTGVRIFPEGVNRDTKGKEVSKNETRRDARQKRRQTFRTNLRKQHLINALKEARMYPLTSNEKELQKYFLANPYLLRSKALRKKITLLEIGRILYHL
ncbi:MAG: type II CRISPR RNA-guided endonuclease Cas9, partial [Bacteroidota bacterium]|nr:type II CRISPR RNA-guided endonuclease Cas9 [Bacteroidota bacterium]